MVGILSLRVRSIAWLFVDGIAIQRALWYVLDIWGCYWRNEINWHQNRLKHVILRQKIQRCSKHLVILSICQMWLVVSWSLKIDFWNCSRMHTVIIVQVSLSTYWHNIVLRNSCRYYITFGSVFYVSFEEIYIKSNTNNSKIWVALQLPLVVRIIL